MNETFVLCIFFSSLISLSLFSFLFFLLILYVYHVTFQWDSCEIFITQRLRAKTWVLFVYPLKSIE